jgi:hypothetical protein
LISLDLRLATLAFTLAGFAALFPLMAVYPRGEFKGSGAPIGLSSALIWGALGGIFVFSFWDQYYRFFYPLWLRGLTAVDAILYALVGLVLWWLAARLPGNPVLWFGILGGLEGVAEQLIGALALNLMSNVPGLAETGPLPLTLLAFSQYLLGWTLVAWLGLGLNRVLQKPATQEP